MRKLFSITLIGVLSLGVAFSAMQKKVTKGEMMSKSRYVERAEADRVILGQEHGDVPNPSPSSRNNFGEFTRVDSSGNGYGMVVTATRPLWVDPANTGYWSATYRQYCGEGTTHGQLGSAVSSNGTSWTTEFNVNANGNPPWGGGIGTGNGGTGTSQARYPSAVGTEEWPLSVWNEYTGDTSTGSTYGGRPYYALDEFGWEEGGWIYPLDVDLLWTSANKDLWCASTASSYDSGEGMPVINASFTDWTRSENYFFHSEAVLGVDIIMGEEQVVISEADLTAGTEDGSYNTNQMLSCTNDGICGIGIVGLFPGGADDVSDITNNHTGIFKMSEDHGASWHGCNGSAEQGCAPSGDGTGYYFIPDNVWNDLMASQFNYEYTDECDGTTDLINDFWTYYDPDFKIDSEGNPHFVIQTLGCGAEYCYYMPESGIYHFTIDKDYLDNPGPVNTPTGWNWSLVITGELTWGWADMTGTSYVWQTHSSLSFSVDNPDVVYVTTNMATEGPNMTSDANLADPCYLSDWTDFPEWSQDIYVSKSTDGGQTWWNPANVTDTVDDTNNSCPNAYAKCDPSETYPHAAQWATDDWVAIMYQMPDWNFNEIGDLGHADFKNVLFMGPAHVTVDNEDEYGAGSSCYADLGDVTGDGIINVLDIIGLVNHILGMQIQDDVCAADYTQDGIVNVLDIIGLVNNILGIGRIDVSAATDVIIHTNEELSIEANGHVQGVYLKLSHNDDFSIELTDAFVAEYYTHGNETSLIIVNGISNTLSQLATINGDYEIVEADIAVPSEGAAILLEEENVGINEAPNSEEAPDSGNILPNGYNVSSAYPNPFNPSTSFTIDLDNEAFVSIKAYNIVGQLVETVYSGNLNGYGNHISWNASNASSGIYFIKTQVGNYLETQKVLLVK